MQEYENLEMGNQRGGGKTGIAEIRNALRLIYQPVVDRVESEFQTVRDA